MEFSDYCRTLRHRYPPGRKVLLVQTPQVLLSTFRTETARGRGYYAFPPTGLQCLYESIGEMALGMEVRILDLNLEILRHACEKPDFDVAHWLDIFAAALDDFQPDLVGVSCMYDSGIEALLTLLQWLKERDQALVVAGGIIATYEWQTLLERSLCHFTVAGEGENKIRHLISQWLGKGAFAATPGIRFRHEETIQESTGPTDVVTFDRDLIASYEQVRVETHYRYGSLNPFSRMAGLEDTPFAAIQMHRGCRAACTFCSVRDFNGKRVRRRRVETVLREMAFLVEQRGVRHFEWLDDDLLFFKSEFQSLLRAIIARKWPITWSASNGLIAAAIDDETTALIQDSGCIGFRVGFETGNAEILKEIRKPGNLAKYARACGIIRRYPDIFVGANLMLGFPEERFRQMMDTFLFYLDNGMDWGGFCTVQAIRGASAFETFDAHFAAQMAGDGQNINNFLPARRSADGELAQSADIATGFAVFQLAPESVPSAEQVAEIWLTFNLVGNFIFNRNLQPGGRVQKFISYVEMARVPYPDNPYMALFLALAYRMDGQSEAVVAPFLAIARRQHDQNPYWRHCFQQFGLDGLLTRFPRDQKAARAALAALGRVAEPHFRHWTPLGATGT